MQENPERVKEEAAKVRRMNEGVGQKLPADPVERGYVRVSFSLLEEWLHLPPGYAIVAVSGPLTSQGDSPDTLRVYLCKVDEQLPDAVDTETGLPVGWGEIDYRVSRQPERFEVEMRQGDRWNVDTP